MNTVRVNTYRDGSRAITFNTERLFALNASLLDDEAKTLPDFAAEDPVAAYDYIRREIGNSATVNALDISVDKRLLAASILDGKEETGQCAAAIMLQHLPAPYEGPFEVSIRVADEMSEPSSNYSLTAEICKLYIEPPDMAN